MHKYRSIVHIGFHKTGSTSIQAFLSLMRSRICISGYAYYHGMHIEYNHVELHAASMRDGRLSPFRFRTGNVSTPRYKEKVAESIKKFSGENLGKCLIFSAEGLSYLRFEDEIDWISTAIPGPLLIVAYLQNKADYISSYEREMIKHNMPGVDDENSVAYVGPSTWLIDYEARLKPFRTKFGEENVLVIDYDAETAKYGSVIPSFIRILDLTDEFSPQEQEIFLNKSRKPTS